MDTEDGKGSPVLSVHSVSVCSTCGSTELHLMCRFITEMIGPGQFYTETEPGNCPSATSILHIP